MWYGRNRCLLRILAVLILVLAVLCAHIWHRKQSGDQSSKSGASKSEETPTSALKTDENYTTGKGKFTLNTEPSSESENPFGKYKQRDFRHVDQNISEVLNNMSLSGKVIYTVPGFAISMALVNTSIWIPLYLENYVIVISLVTGNEISRIAIPNVKTIYTVLQVNDEVLLASDNGLFVLSAAGLIQYQVAGGRFYDISNDGDILLACTGLNTNVIQIRVLVHDDKKMIAVREILIEKKMDHSGYVSMTLYNKHIYLRPINIGDANIYQYTLGGELARTYTSNGQGTANDAFRLSMVDIWGTILMCDWGNQKFLRLTARGEWQAYSAGGVVRPWDVIIVDNYLYIYSWDEIQSIGKISQFEIVK